ncbi:MAG: DUF4149 domain-containing protein [Pseudohongiellaceae bacterium]
MNMLIELSILLLLAVLAGSMVFFSFVMAPLIHIKLDAPVAARFIRAVFPWYYLVVIVLAAAAALLLAADSLLLALVMAAVALAGVYLHLWLMPRINRWRDKGKEGDDAAQKRFDAGHRLSVLINGVQLLAVLAVIVLFVLPSGI